LLGAAAAGAFGARLELQRRYAAGHLEYLPVGGTADRQGFVLGQAESPLLQQFLQARLWILQRARIRQAGEQLPEGGMDEFRGGLDVAVEIDGADDRFQRIRQHRAAAKAAGFQFAGAEPQHVADLQRLRDVRQRLAVHQRGAQPGEIAFAVADIAAEKKIGDHHAEHGVAEKFQPFVVGRRGAARRQRADEVSALTEPVSQPAFQASQFIHQRLSSALCSNSMSSHMLPMNWVRASYSMPTVVPLRLCVILKSRALTRSMSFTSRRFWMDARSMAGDSLAELSAATALMMLTTERYSM